MTKELTSVNEVATPTYCLNSKFPLVFFIERASPTWGCIISGVLASASWGIATVMSKGVVEVISPLTLLVVQLVASVSILWTVVAVQKSRLPLQWSTLKVGLTGLLEPGLTFAVTLIGLTYTTASKASLIIGAVEPVLIIILAAILLKERVTRTLAALTGLACVGVVLVLGNHSSTSSNSLLGDGLILLGTFFAALYVVLARRLIVNLSPLLSVALQQSFGLLLALLLLSYELWRAGIITSPTATWTDWALALLSGVIQYALAFWFYLTALRGMQANAASLFITLIPIFGIGGAYLFLGERLTLAQWSGVILVLIAVANMTRLHKTEKSHAS